MITAYLIDKDGKIHEELVIRAKNPQEDVDAMNGTCEKATEGKLRWTLERPIKLSKAEKKYLEQEEGILMARIDDGKYDEDMDGCAS